MGIFSYTGIDKEGKERKGIIEAPSKTVAYKKLKKLGIFPYEITEEKRVEKRDELKLPLLKKGISESELIVLFRTLSTLLKAGIPITEAIDSFSESEESKEIKVFLKKVLEGLREGNSLHTALKEAGVKDETVLALIKAGEKSSLLPESLETASRIIEQKEEIKGKLIQVLIYPSVLLITALGVVIFMLTAVVPKIVKIYKSAKLALPLSTKIVISLSKLVLNHYFLISIILTVLSIIGAVFYKEKRETFDKFKLKLPIIGKLIAFAELQKFFETLGRLLKSGVPLIEAIETSRLTIRNTYLKNKLGETIKKVEKGIELYREFDKIGEIPKVVIQLVKAGERAGSLGEMCIKSSNYLKGEFEFKIKGLTSLIEPATMLIVGLIIGFIVYALLLPIVSISTIKPV